MTRKELIDAINATIITNGKKGITAAVLNNILIEMTNQEYSGNENNSGNNTGGNTIINNYNLDLVEIKTDPYNNGLTEEDRRVNASAYTKSLKGESCIYYTVIDDVVVLITTLAHANNSNNKFEVLVESSMFSYAGLKSYAVTITPNGDIFDKVDLEDLTKLLDSMPVFVDNVSNYDDISEIFSERIQKSASQSIGRNILVAGLGVSDVYSGTGELPLLVLDEANKEAIGLYRGLIFGELGVFVANETSFNFNLYKNGVVYLYPNEGFQTECNKLVFGTLDANLTTFVIRDWTTSSEYSVVSYFGSGDTYYQFVIYRNNSFETWKLKQDGTTEQITD